LLKTVDPTVVDATPVQIEQAAWKTVPPIGTVFWTFRFMVLFGFYFIVLFATMFYRACVRKLETARWLLWVCVFSLPLPWIAAELGWMTAEIGRQPWTIDSVLPTALSISSLPAAHVALSVAGFVLAYSSLFVVEMFLMVRAIRLGPYPSYPAATGAGPRAAVPAE
jgi:cytochrome d ubiquinol oxidase subunit I